MKVLQVAPAYYPAHRHGGPIKSIHELSRKLVQLGVKVTVFTSNMERSTIMDVPVEHSTVIDGVEVFYFPVTWPRSYLRAPRLDLALQQRVQEFDLVHINGLYLYPTMAAGRACRRQRVPYLISPRGMLNPNAVAHGNSLKKRLYLWMVESKNLKGATAVHFTSSDEQRLATERIPHARSFVVPNALSLDDYPLPLGETETSLRHREEILFLGRIHPIKGLDLLIPAFAKVVATRPDAHLHLVGPDENGYLEVVQKLIATYNLSQRVTYSGLLMGEEKLRAFHQADVFVLPSYSESFGIVVAEAMACQKPVVITDQVNIHQDVQKAGAGIVAPCDIEQIAQAITTILQDPNEGREMGKRGRKLVEEKYTWDQVAQSMLQVYLDITGKKQAALQSEP